MRKELFAMSMAMAVFLAAESYGSPLVYLPALAAVLLVYAYMRGKRAPLAPIVLGAAFLLGSFTYPWDTAHIIILSLVWPGIFALFALHSVPESPDMERNVLVAWGTVSLMSALMLYLVPAMISTVPNPVFLALVGLFTGLALAYLAWK